MIAENLLLWAFALCGAVIAWSAVQAANFMTTLPAGAKKADPWGWSMTGMVGLWAALQPFSDAPVTVSLPVVIMGLSLAVQSWRLAHAYRVESVHG